jgi:type I restriction enzyme M protein
MVALPGQLFDATQIPACRWFIARDKKNGRFHDRRGEVLFIDARKLVIMIERTHRGLAEEDIRRIADTYHAWRGDHSKSSLLHEGEGKGEGVYNDIPGFCRAATLEDIGMYGHGLTPGRYVGAEQTEDDDEPFEKKMARLSAERKEQMQRAARLDTVIWTNLEDLGDGR